MRAAAPTPHRPPPPRSRSTRCEAIPTHPSRALAAAGSHNVCAMAKDQSPNHTTTGICTQRHLITHTAHALAAHRIYRRPSRGARRNSPFVHTAHLAQDSNLGCQLSVLAPLAVDSRRQRVCSGRLSAQDPLGLIQQLPRIPVSPMSGRG